MYSNYDFFWFIQINQFFNINLFQAYSKSIKYPNGAVVAEEIFHSGIIPSDTDFRIFRDYGNIPGMDFAHVFNGYRYHTKYDNIDYISYEVLQHTGDNIMALTKEIANSEELLDTKSYAKGSAVFFDILSFVFVSYTKEIGILINIIVAVLTSTVPFLALSRSIRGAQNKYLKREVQIGAISTILSLFISMGVCYVLGTVYDSLDKSMSWYAMPYLVIGLYCCPALGTQFLVHVIVDQLLSRGKAPVSLALKVQLQQCGTTLLWSSLVMGITLTGYRSGYIGTVMLLCIFVSSGIINIIGLQNSGIYINIL